jgi:hypothetical protein
MRSNEVTQLFNSVRVGTKIDITNANLHGAIAQATLKQQSRNVRMAAQTRGPRVAAN